MYVGGKDGRSARLTFLVSSMRAAVWWLVLASFALTAASVTAMRANARLALPKLKHHDTARALLDATHAVIFVAHKDKQVAHLELVVPETASYFQRREYAARSCGLQHDVESQQRAAVVVLAGEKCA